MNVVNNECRNNRYNKINKYNSSDLDNTFHSLSLWSYNYNRLRKKGDKCYILSALNENVDLNYTYM